jgi:hypothetical protein
LSISLLATFAASIAIGLFINIDDRHCSYYGLFVMGGSIQALAVESIVIVGFSLVSILGFTLNLWLVVGALFVHGIFDFFHARHIESRCARVVADVLSCL